MKQLLLLVVLFSQQLLTQAQTPATPYIQNLVQGQENLISFPMDFIGMHFAIPGNDTWRWRSSKIKMLLCGTYITGPTATVYQAVDRQTTVQASGSWRFNDFNIIFPPLYSNLAYIEATYTLTIWHEYNGKKSEEIVYQLRKPKWQYIPPGWYTPEKP